MFRKKVSLLVYSIELISLYILFSLYYKLKNLKSLASYLIIIDIVVKDIEGAKGA